MALEEDVQRGWPDLTPFARDLLKGREDADDIAQDLWVALQRRPHSVRTVRPWLSVAIRRIAFRKRQQDLRRAERERAVARPVLVPSAVELAESESERAFLAALVDQLAEPYREVVRLRYLEDRSAEEIAARLGRPNATVRSQLKRGLDQLRVRLGTESQRPRRLAAILAGPWRDIRRSGARSALMAGIAAGVVAVGVLLVGAGVDRQELVATLPDAETTSEPRMRELARGTTARLPVTVAEAPAVSAASPATADDPWSTAVEGTVIDPEGAPVPGADVLAGELDGTEARVVARSDERGRYRIPRVDRRRALWAEDRVRIPSARHFVGTSPAGNALDLRLGHAHGSLIGRVLAADGSPVHSASVTLLGASDRLEVSDQLTLASGALHQRVLTGDDGAFELGQSTSRFFRLLVEASDRSPVVTAFERMERLPQRVEVVLAAPSALEGRVVRSDGTPAASTRLQLSFPPPIPAREVDTDENGAFRFEAVASGPHVLRLLSSSANALESCFLAGTLSAGERAWRDVTLAQGHTIHGRMLDGDAPLVGWTVELWDTNPVELQRDHRVLRTTEDGGFAFPSCTPGGRYVLRLFERTDAAGVPCAVVRGVRPSAAPLLLRPGEGALVPGSLAGRLESPAPALRPLVACLRGDAFPTPLMLRVDPETGAFDAPNVPAGVHQVCAWIPHVGTWVAGDVEVQPGERAELVVRVPEAGELRIRVDSDSLEAERSVTVATAAFHGADARSVQRLRPSPDDERVFTGLLMPGEYDYWLTAGRSIDHHGRARIEPGATTEQTVALGELVPLTVRLELDRPLLNSETVMCSVVVHDEQRDAFLSPGRIGRSEEFLVRVPRDASELRVSTSHGLRGRLVLSKGDVAAGGELQVTLAPSQDD